MKNVTTKELHDYLYLDQALTVLFNRLFPNWEFADVTIGGEYPWDCKKSLVNKLMRDGKAEIELSDQEGSYVMVVKVTINEGYVVNAIYEMEAEPWNEGANLDDDYYYHQDISWKRVY